MAFPATPYFFQGFLAWDPNAKAAVADSTVEFFADGDTSFSTPLEVWDWAGNSLGYGVVTTDAGYGAPYVLAVPFGVAKSGAYETPVQSFRGLKEAVDAAVAAAQAAAEQVGAGGGATTLDGLTDVSAAGAATGRALVKGATGWAPSSAAPVYEGDPRVITGVNAFVGTVVRLTDPAAARVHPVTGADLGANACVMWVTTTLPANFQESTDAWIRPANVEIVGTAEYASPSTSTTHQITLPSGILTGDTIILIGATADDSVDVSSWPTDFEEVVEESVSGCKLYVAQKGAVTADANAVVTVTVDATTVMPLVALVLRNTPDAALAQTATATAASGATQAVPSAALAVTAAVLQVVAVASPGGAAAETLTAFPTEDCYVDSGNPDTVYAAVASQNVVRLGTPEYRSFVKFTLPAAPAGKTLTAARLRVRTTTDAFAGSAMAMTVDEMSDTSWVATTTTWNNQPAVSGPLLGTLAGGSAVDTEYTITLDEAEISGNLGGTYAIALRGSGATNDSIYLWSGDHASATYKPQIQLDFDGGATDPSEPTMPAGFTEAVSTGTASAGASGVALRVAYEDLLAVLAGQTVGGDTWTVDSIPRVAALLGVRVAMP